MFARATMAGGVVLLFLPKPHFPRAQVTTVAATIQNIVVVTEPGGE